MHRDPNVRERPWWVRWGPCVAAGSEPASDHGERPRSHTVELTPPARGQPAPESPPWATAHSSIPASALEVPAKSSSHGERPTATAPGHGPPGATERPCPSWTWVSPLQAEMGVQPNGVLLRGTSLGVQPPGSSETGYAWEFSAGGQGRGPDWLLGVSSQTNVVRLTGNHPGNGNIHVSGVCVNASPEHGGVTGGAGRAGAPALLRPS